MLTRERFAVVFAVAISAAAAALVALRVDLPSGDIRGFVRVFAVLLGGVTFGITTRVAPLMLHRATRMEALAIRLFLLVHLSILFYVAGVLAERAHDPISWQAPAAIFIFTLKGIVLLLLREVALQREVSAAPPQRRAADLV